MKLAKALMLRADAQNRLQSLRERIGICGISQEGEQPVEDPNALLEEAYAVSRELKEVVTAINLANVNRTLADGRSVTAALAEREELQRRHALLRTTIGAATPDRHTRYSASEIRWVTTIDVPALRRKSDEVARELRELDVLIQETNWSVEL